jgi:sulfur-oxidizing protein SoxY
MKRRHFLQNTAGLTTAQTALGLGLMSGFIPMAHAQQTAAAVGAGAWNKAAFEQKTMAEVAKAMGSAAAPALSQDLVLNTQEIAENGNVVPFGAQSNIPGTTQMAFLVEKNPNALAAMFDILPGQDANVTTRVKMGQSSNVFVIAKAGDKFFYNVKEVKVTLGGCGG